MKTYRIVWLSLCGVLGAVGVPAAMMWSTTATLAISACAAVAAVALTSLRRLWQEQVPSRSRARLAATDSLLGGSAAAAVVGLVALLGAGPAFAVTALLVCGSPGALRLTRRLGQTTGDDSPHESDTEFEAETLPLLAVDPELLSDRELGVAWQASFSALEGASSLAQRLRIVEARRGYLDELERRDPLALTAWLAAGARAAGNPTRFVEGGGSARRTAIDWDGLTQGPDR